MRLLNDSIPQVVDAYRQGISKPFYETKAIQNLTRLANPGRVLKCFLVSILLLGIQAEIVEAQQNELATPRKSSRYRLVESVKESPLAQLAGTEEAPQLEYEDGLPETDSLTSANCSPLNCGQSLSRIRTAETEKPDESKSSRIAFAGYSASNPQKESAPSILLKQTESWGTPNAYDSSVTYMDRFAGPTQFPFRDQYQSFPPRAGFKTLYGENLGDMLDRRGNPATMFGVHRSECCDEWGGYCPCTKTDYQCGCGGLKVNAGHCLFKRVSSGEPCETALGNNPLSKCRCGKTGCRVNGFRKSGCGSECSGGCGAESGCGCVSTSKAAASQCSSCQPNCTSCKK